MCLFTVVTPIATPTVLSFCRSVLSFCRAQGKSFYNFSHVTFPFRLDEIIEKKERNERSPCHLASF